MYMHICTYAAGTGVCAYSMNVCAAGTLKPLICSLPDHVLNTLFYLQGSLF